MAVDIDKVESIIGSHGEDEKALIQAMLAIQEEFNFLPKEALEIISEQLNVPMIRIYQVAAFYKVFSLEPRGKHIITVCKGTACHVRGSSMLVDQVNRVLKIDPDERQPMDLVRRNQDILLLLILLSPQHLVPESPSEVLLLPYLIQVPGSLCHHKP